MPGNSFTVHLYGALKDFPVVIMGTGANARETRSVVGAINEELGTSAFDLLGFVSESRPEDAPPGVNIVCDDEGLGDIAKKYDRLGVIIPAASPAVKKKIYDQVSRIPSIVLPSIVHPRANVLERETLTLGRGCIITAGVFVSICVTLGDFVYLNYNCSIGHDTTIGNFCTVNPQAAVSGNISIEDMCLIGADSAIKQGLTIGKNSVIGLGAFVVRSVPADTVMVCRPAEPM